MIPPCSDIGCFCRPPGSDIGTIPRPPHGFLIQRVRHWNGGQKLKNGVELCGHKMGGKICKAECDMAVNVWVCRNVWTGDPIHRETVWSRPEVCGMGSKSVI